MIEATNPSPPHEGQCSSCNFTGPGRRTWDLFQGGAQFGVIRLCPGCKGHAERNDVTFNDRGAQLDLAETAVGRRILDRAALVARTAERNEAARNARIADRHGVIDA